MLSLAPCRFPRGRVQFQACTCSYFSRGNVSCAEDSHLRHVLDTLLSSAAPPSLRRLDQTGHLIAAALDADRFCPKQVRTGGRKCEARDNNSSCCEDRVKRPACTKTDRMLLVLLAKIVRSWKQALFITQPETLLRGPRQGFKLLWRYKSRAALSSQGSPRRPSP
jgi:hypothetical protein